MNKTHSLSLQKMWEAKSQESQYDLWAIVPGSISEQCKLPLSFSHNDSRIFYNLGDQTIKLTTTKNSYIKWGVKDKSVVNINKNS